MLFKLLISALGLYFFSAFSTTLAEVPVADQQTNKRINYLKTQISEPSGEQRAQKKKRKTSYKITICSCYQEKERNSEQCCQHYVSSPLSIGPYLNKDAIFNGSTLIINVPTIREDSRLLMQQYQLVQECYELGIPIPDLPRVTLSGKLEGQTFYSSTYSGSQDDININFSGAELDAYIQGNSWVLGYIALDSASDKHQDGSRLFMNRAFIAIGNLSQFPLYISIGQVYVPFGRYSSLMVTAPVTQVLGRTKAHTLTFGYQQTGNNSNVLHVEVYGFQSSISNNLTCNSQNNEWGADIGYEFDNGQHLNGEIGVDYISSLVDSQGIKTTIFLNTENLKHHIPALDIYGTLVINSVVLFTEYVDTIKSLNIKDISFTNQGVVIRRRCPKAFHAEASYRFKMGSKPSSIGVGYGHTSQASTLGLPQDRYSIFYNMSIWRDTNLSLEYRHDINYPIGIIFSSTKSGYNPTPNVVPAKVITEFFGKSDNAITAQFDLSF